MGIYVTVGSDWNRKWYNALADEVEVNDSDCHETLMEIVNMYLTLRIEKDPGNKEEATRLMYEIIQGFALEMLDYDVLGPPLDDLFEDVYPFLAPHIREDTTAIIEFTYGPANYIHGILFDLREGDNHA